MVVFVPVLMEGLVIQMESAFLNWDMTDRCVKHVKFEQTFLYGWHQVAYVLAFYNLH